MSQIKWKIEYKGKQAEVMTGWDPPLGYYHLTIFDLDPNAEDELLWDGLGNLGFCRKLDTIRKTLDDLGITCPPGLFELIDQREGNTIYRWEDDEWQKVR